MNETIKENNEDFSLYLTFYIITEVIGIFGTFAMFAYDTGPGGALNGLVGLMMILVMLGIRIVLTIVAFAGRYFFAKRSKSPAFKRQAKTVLRINLFITVLFSLLIFSMIVF